MRLEDGGVGLTGAAGGLGAPGTGGTKEFSTLLGEGVNSARFWVAPGGGGGVVLAINERLAWVEVPAAWAGRGIAGAGGGGGVLGG